MYVVATSTVVKSVGRPASQSCAVGVFFCVPATLLPHYLQKIVEV